MTAAECVQNATLVTAGTLTVGTDNPAYPPYFQGGTAEGVRLEDQRPDHRQGVRVRGRLRDRREAGLHTGSGDVGGRAVQAVLRARARRPSTSTSTRSRTRRAREAAVDFSDSYYDVNQALVAVKGTPIASATSIADLKDYMLGAPLGTTSYDFIQNVIQPTTASRRLSDSSSTPWRRSTPARSTALVVDYPTAFYMADPYVQEVKNSIVVGQFPNPDGRAGVLRAWCFEKGSPLVACVNHGARRDEGRRHARRDPEGVAVRQDERRLRSSSSRP